MDAAGVKYDGLKEALDKARKEEDEITDNKFNIPEHECDTIANKLYITLKANTMGETLNAVMGTAEGNGFEAWRRINAYHEPRLATSKGVAFQKLAATSREQAKSPAALKKAINELDMRARKYFEIAGCLSRR